MSELTLDLLVDALVKQEQKKIREGEKFHPVEDICDLHERFLWVPIPFQFYDEFLNCTVEATYTIWSDGTDELYEEMCNLLKGVTPEIIHSINHRVLARCD